MATAALRSLSVVMATQKSSAAGEFVPVAVSRKLAPSVKHGGDKSNVLVELFCDVELQNCFVLSLGLRRNIDD